MILYRLSTTVVRVTDPTVTSGCHTVVTVVTRDVRRTNLIILGGTGNLKILSRPDSRRVVTVRVSEKLVSTSVD
jgi:hypothetical protein